MTYLQLLDELNGLKEEDFARFQRKLIPTKQEILGVRTPHLRKLAKKYQGERETLLTFPDEVYEITFIKLDAVSKLPYEEFLPRLETCVGAMDNWATCDLFKARCIQKRREEFIPYIRDYAQRGEFFQRFALVTLLNFYCEKSYLPLVFEILQTVNCDYFYVHMAAAWLTAETLVKEYETGRKWLKRNKLPQKTHNKAIQKARESFRLNEEQKKELAHLRRR